MSPGIPRVGSGPCLRHSPSVGTPKTCLSLTGSGPGLTSIPLVLSVCFSLLQHIVPFRLGLRYYFRLEDL